MDISRGLYEFYIGESMTDLEMTKWCAEAMGYCHAAYIDNPQSYPIVQLVAPSTGFKHEKPHFLFIECPSEGEYPEYDPLHDDAQTMALVKKFDIQIEGWSGDRNVYILNYAQFVSNTKDLNRAIVECVAKMQAAA